MKESNGSIDQKNIKEDFKCSYKFNRDNGNIIFSFNYPFTLMVDDKRLLTESSDKDEITKAFDLYVQPNSERLDNPSFNVTKLNFTWEI